MLVLGLGSNQGDRLENLRRALALLKQIPDFSISQISPVYVSDALVPDDAPSKWDIPYFNLSLRCESSLNPYVLLKHLKEIEIKVGRTPEKKWGPRIIDIDLLAWDDLIQYDEKLHIPHEHLHDRPFALWPFADIAPEWIYPLPGVHQGKTAAEMVTQWGSRFDGNAPFHTQQIQQRIDTPQLVGILNLTPDSFSDGGEATHLNSAVDKFRELILSGAEVIDIGAEATGPKAISLTSEEEWQRLAPFLETIMSELKDLSLQPKISIDTRHAQTAKKALDLGVNWINDVTGLCDPAMREIIASQPQCDVVIMHNLGVPVSNSSLIPSKENPVDVVHQWAEVQLNLLSKQGISENRIILDIGIGYGKTAAQSLALIREIERFRDLNTRLLVGHSRKSFLQQFTVKPAAQRDIETVVLSLYLANKQVNFLRVHDVMAHARAFKVANACGSLF